MKTVARMIIFCFECKEETPHRHMHDTAHGISETHMSGSERYECIRCTNRIHPDDHHPFLPESAWRYDKPTQRRQFAS